MRRPRLDRRTADRLLSGAVAPEDAPPQYAVLAQALDSVRPRPADGALPGEATTVAAMGEAVRGQQATDLIVFERTRPRVRLLTPKIAAVVFAGTLASGTGLAFAGALPGAAQDVAKAVLAKIGVTVPGPNAKAGTHPGARGRSSIASSPSASPFVSPSPNKGAVISNLARTTTAEGVEHGATVCTAASEGKCQAGQNGKPSPSPSPSVSPSASPSPSPSASSTASAHGGSGRADLRSGGKSAQGTSNANTRSGGRSARGSSNTRQI